MNHLESLEHEDAPEPVTRCPGRLLINMRRCYDPGNDVYWNVCDCERCYARVYVVDQPEPHPLNFEIPMSTPSHLFGD